MSWFARIEEGCAAFIERAFASMFPSDVEPAQIARKLVATMEARSANSEGTVSAPAAYCVFVNPLDFARLSQHQTYLEGEWSALLADVAQRVGIRLDGTPGITLKEHPRVPAGAIEVHAVLAGEADEAPAQFRLLPLGDADAPGHAVNGATRVGRSAQCDIVLSDPSVSRNHALLDVQGSTLSVHDAGSTNGTFVNGERIDTHTLAPGDTIAFGKSLWTCASVRSRS
ncbi:MAG: FhaA domain-containing protein [Candidatus Baltobacteraceae bacterium]